MPRMITPFTRQIARWSLADTNRGAWLELRRQGLGGSDMPAVAGMDDRHTRWEIWLSKTAPELDAEPEDGSRSEEMIWFGHQMEAVAAKRFKMKHPGTHLTRLGMIARADPEQAWARVNIDFRVTGCEHGPCIAEVKNRSAWVARDWDPGGDTEKVPDSAVIQVMWALIVLGGPPAGYTHGHLLAVIGGNELREYTVWWDQALADILIGEGEWFWHEHVLTKTPPPVDAAERTGRILARMWDAAPDAYIVADAETANRVEWLRDAEAIERAAAENVKQFRHQIMAEMEDAEILLAPDGRTLVTWRRNSTFRENDFQAEQPEAFAAYTRTVEVTDTRKLAEADPDLYRKYRSRAFRVAKPPKDK